MSRTLLLECPRNPAGGLLPNSLKHDRFHPLFALSLILFTPAGWAENLGMELLSTGITPAAIIEEPGDPIEEIVVFGIREQDDADEARQLLEDPLLKHVLRDFELSQQLERDTTHNEEAAGIGPMSPRLRLGYAPREELREAVDEEPSRLLPLDLVRPAIVIELDF